MIISKVIDRRLSAILLFFSKDKLDKGGRIK